MGSNEGFHTPPNIALQGGLYIAIEMDHYVAPLTALTLALH
jgi:hypothetical protein